jgi:hypothetical protein
MELPTSPNRSRVVVEPPTTPGGSAAAPAPSLLTSHPLVDYLLSLEEGGSLTPQVLNLLFAAVRECRLLCLWAPGGGAVGLRLFALAWRSHVRLNIN